MKTTPDPRPRAPLPRRWILALAVLAALAVVALWPEPRHATTPAVVIVADAQAADAPAPPKAPDAPAAPPAPAAAAAPPSTDAGPSAAVRGAEITIDEHGVRIEPKGGTAAKRRHAVVVDGSLDGLGSGSNPPSWVGAVAMFTVFVIFVVPLIGVALIVWYKMRRTRMLNETLQRYADKGLAPPPEALQLLGGNAAAVAAAQSMPPGTPAYDQARAVRKRVAWSDLRKGVLAAGVGLGLTLWSLFDDQSANALGLVLLFVGIGYVVLWFFEDRRPGTRDGGA